MYGGNEARAIPQMQQSQPARETHVASQTSRQGQLVDELGKVLSVLESRLQPILRDTPPMPALAGRDGLAKDTIQLVGLARSIANQNDQLQNLIHSVTDIIDRLEL